MEGKGKEGQQVEHGFRADTEEARMDSLINMRHLHGRIVIATSNSIYLCSVS